MTDEKPDVASPRGRATKLKAPDTSAVAAPLMAVEPPDGLQRGKHGHGLRLS